MRTIKLLFLLGILLTGLASEATAQNWADRGYFNVSFGGQLQDQTFSESATFTIYGETGALASGHSFGGGHLYDISAGARVWRNFGVGLGYSANKNKNDATVSVRVPHPVIFGQFREATAIATDLEHTENAVHLQVVWRMPVTDKIDLMFMAGPSFFTVRQGIATVQAPQDIRDQAPFTSVAITSVTVTDVKASPVGVNVGVDGTYAITRIEGMGVGSIGIGVGGFLRYAGASLELPTLAGTTREGDPRAGGVQAGLGLRVRF